MALHWFVVVLCCLSSVSSHSSSSMNPKCKTMCGNISIPYPFGMGQDPICFRNKVFRITCDESVTPHKALLKGDLEVLNISLEGTLRINVPIPLGSRCYTNPSKETDNYPGYRYHFESSPYTISNTANKFIAIGRNILTNVTGYSNARLAISTQGCVPTSTYSDSDSDSDIDECVDCCQSSIPAGLTRFAVNISSTQWCVPTSPYSDSYIHDCVDCCHPYIPAGLTRFAVNISSRSHTSVEGLCSYSSFLADIDYHEYSLAVDKKVPVVLNWMAEWNETCFEAAIRNKTDYACQSKHSFCYDSSIGTGYRCNCSNGYEGNPYLNEGGCKEIVKCKRGGSYDCKSEGYMAYIALGTVLITPFLLIPSILTISFWMKRRARKLNEKFFQQNGGLMLQQKICSRKGDAFKIFTIEELKRATNSFNARTIVGQGGFGVVYKGVLPNNRIVAIKKSKLVDAGQVEQFINELDILSQINHRNVVKLVGCCLEDQVPILVYEFISNGTLYHHIHEAGNLPSISLENRLRIATEIAEALAYLHSSASMPIFHRDVKSANILLDNNLIAKVADFGVSRLVPIDHTHITTLVQGTWGYLDPESFQTGKLTDKSDVYSFGVVLVELLTGEKAVCLNRPQEDRNLAMYFVHAMQEDCLFQTLEERVRSEASEEQLTAIAQLAIRCLRFKGDERPTMKEVLVDLQVLRRLQNHRWVHDQETGRLRCETSQSCTEDAGGQCSTENHCDMSLTLNR